jgi:hypothetical protein
MSPIRASEIGSYLYCARAWWYRQQGLPSCNQAEMTGGMEQHQQHGGRVWTAGVLRGLALLFLLAGLLLLGSHFITRIF